MTNPTGTDAQPAHGVQIDQITSASVGTATTRVATVATVKDRKAGSPPLLPFWNGLAPGGGAGHCQSPPTKEPAPSPPSRRATVSPNAGASRSQRPVSTRPAANRSTIIGTKTVSVESTRPQRSAAPEIPVVMWVQTALPS